MNVGVGESFSLENVGLSEFNFAASEAELGAAFLKHKLKIELLTKNHQYATCICEMEKVLREPVVNSFQVIFVF